MSDSKYMVSIIFGMELVKGENICEFMKNGWTIATEFEKAMSIKNNIRFVQYINALHNKNAQGLESTIFYVSYKLPDIDVDNYPDYYPYNMYKCSFIEESKWVTKQGYIAHIDEICKNCMYVTLTFPDQTSVRYNYALDGRYLLESDLNLIMPYSDTLGNIDIPYDGWEDAKSLEQLADRYAEALKDVKLWEDKDKVTEINLAPSYQRGLNIDIPYDGWENEVKNSLENLKNDTNKADSAVLTDKYIADSVRDSKKLQDNVMDITKHICGG